jgi:hypothetical protein
MKRYFLLGLFLLSVVAARAQQVEYKPNFEITLTGGYQFGGSVDETYKLEGVDFYGESLGIEGSEMFGVIFDYRLGPKLLLEFSLDRQNTKLNYSDTSNTGFVKLSDMHVSYYHVGLIYSWGKGSVQPFAGGTVGLTGMVPTEGLDSEVRFSAGPLFGIKTFSSKHFAFRFQTRLMVTNMPDGQYFPNAAGESYNHVLNSYMVQMHFTIGLVVGL